MGLKDYFRKKPKTNVTPSLSATHESNVGFSSYHDVLNSYDFYFQLLPIIWSSPERQKMLYTLFDTKSEKACMMAILLGLNAAFFPEQQKNAMMKAIGTKHIEDFNDENYSKLYAIERVNLDPEYHILEIAFFNSQSQNMINKVEKVFLTCTKSFSHGRVITLEFNPLLNEHLLCEAGLGNLHANFGTVSNNNVYERLKEIIKHLRRTN